MIKFLFFLIASSYSIRGYMQSALFVEIGEYTSQPTIPDDYISILNARRIVNNNIKACEIYLISINHKANKRDTVFKQKFEYYRNGFLKSWQNSPNSNSVKNYPEVTVTLNFDSLKLEQDQKRAMLKDSIFIEKEYYPSGKLKATRYKQYNENGRIVFDKDILKKSNINAMNGKYYFFYDDSGRLIKEKSYGGDWSWWMSFLFRYEYKYDNNGNLTEASFAYNNKNKIDKIYQYRYFYW